MFPLSCACLPQVCLTLSFPPLFPFFGISLLSWCFYFLSVVTVPDEFTLFNFIASFKVYCFVFCGVLPLFFDFFVFYWELSTPRQPSEGGCLQPSSAAEGAQEVLEDEGLTAWFFWYYDLIVQRTFFAIWLLCWVVYLQYVRVRRFHFCKGASRRPMESVNDLEAAVREWAETDGVRRIDPASGAIHTGDKDTGNFEQRLLMGWDAVVIIAHVACVSLDYALRFDSSLLQAALAPTETSTIVEKFVITSLSIFSAPFLLWKLPVVGELFHQMRPTGFDEAGQLKIVMRLEDMKRKYETTMRWKTKYEKRVERRRVSRVSDSPPLL